MTIDNIIKLDPDTISQRLIESVSMVRELLQSNRELRETINYLNKEKETAENENCVLSGENVELRDRIEVLESIVQAHANSEYEDYDWRKIIEEDQYLAGAPKPTSKGVETVASALMEMKKENRMLKGRIEHLEVQNNNLTQ